ncbi:FAD-binding oxidoreductase [Cognatishimia sp. SS12]|uniref:FAD-binding oxidoreductase n=1 Tax=Cognatishimia sp. SS12 TaxID=2979465 RepID=UPI00232E08CD|nr:FAD-binding oxidoreductase [Cognatishimia sp. SS12]MDC0736908.1 FAD-binding oxidoreductase [Cognatishimia sp. SS12]
MSLRSVDTDFITALSAHLPQDTLRPVEPRYLEEPRARIEGIGGILALPKTTQEVATILKACHAAHVPVVPYGGGTGLVGGQVMPRGGAEPLILSLERMARIRKVDAASAVMVAEAGAILADVQAAAEAAERLFPLSLAAQGSARIGGNLATNAGGLNVLRYGNARDLCLGLEAVLPDGTLWNGLSELRKDNTGYDLKNLLIGAEGTLGVITAASLKLFPRPAAYETAFLVVPDPEAAVALLSLARGQFGEQISAFELMQQQSWNFLAHAFPEMRQPFAEAPAWCVLIELGLSQQGAPGEAIEALFVNALEAGLVQDGAVATSEQQRQQFWGLRESVPLANRKIGAISSHDISVPIARIGAFVAEARAALAKVSDLRINCFGHLGDGNLHFNLFPAEGKKRSDYKDMQDDLKRIVHDLVAAHNGAFSAEHGVGRLKTSDLLRYGDPGKLAMMRAVKAALDPHGIMNPGVIFAEG